MNMGKQLKKKSDRLCIPGEKIKSVSREEEGQDSNLEVPYSARPLSVLRISTSVTQNCFKNTCPKLLST